MEQFHKNCDVNNGQLEANERNKIKKKNDEIVASWGDLHANEVKYNGLFKESKINTKLINTYIMLGTIYSKNK
jgi:hypothetical protein